MKLKFDLIKIKYHSYTSREEGKLRMCHKLKTYIDALKRTYTIFKKTHIKIIFKNYNIKEKSTLFCN